MTAFDSAMQQWRGGEARLAAAPPDQQPALERVTQAIHDQLRRRVGIPFTVDELVAHYDAGTSWCLDIAYATAPGAPWAWDARIVADAAFARYLREATNYAGGQRVEAEEV